MIKHFFKPFLWGQYAPKYPLSEGKISPGKKALYMLIAGIISILAAVLLNPVIPIIKKMWTPTFVLVTVGIGLVLLSFFYWVIDVKNCRKWAFPFQVIGLNSITIYLGQKIIHFGVIRDFFFAGIASKFSQDTGDLILSCAYVLVCWFFLWFFYKKKIFLKV